MFEDVEVADLLADLDERQRLAVATPSTLVAVIASAGSGKTRVLTRRIAHRVAIGTADARHTLALTFTREAAGELRRRLRRSGLRDHVEAGTFHSVALGLLRQRWSDTNRSEPTIVSERERLLAEIADGESVDDLATERTWSAARGVRADAYDREARAANRRRSLPATRIAELLADYETLKRRRGVIDLDDLLLELHHELDHDPGFADAARWRFRHILVDEAQDLNPVQFGVLRALTSEQPDLYLVGDPAQAIFGFNGSDPGLLTDIDRHLPGVEIVRLPTNHRCSPQIVAAGLHVLHAAGLAAEAVSARDDGPPVTVLEAADELQEAQMVAQFVSTLDRALVNTGAVAVLARTHHQITGLDRALTGAGVSVRRRTLVPGSPLAIAVRTAGLARSSFQLRAWAHDVLDAPPAPFAPGDDNAPRRVAAAVLEFLREQPLGDGAAWRAWVGGTNPFAERDETGVELLTFHAAKGREWSIVVVTGVETGLAPHRSATTVEARAEEARLLHVALTRAADGLVLTRAERRGGYGRQPSPFVVGLDTTVAPVAARPSGTVVAARDTDVVRRRTGVLASWRDRAARIGSMLPEQICSDDDLAAIARHPPATADELSSMTGLGPVTAARLHPPIMAALAEAPAPG